MAFLPPRERADIDAKQQALRERIREAVRQAFQRPLSPEEIKAGAARFDSRAIPLPRDIVLEVLRDSYPRRPSREEIIQRGTALLAKQKPPSGHFEGQIIVPLRPE